MMDAERKIVLLCDQSHHDIGRLASWLHETYTHVMATDLERAQYQFGTRKFDLVVGDLKGFEANLWLAQIQGRGQLVLYLNRREVTGRPYLFKPAPKHFETLREPFLQKVAEILGDPPNA